jgi:hypothetical protein
MCRAAEGAWVMAGSPGKRAKREAGELAHPWRENSALSTRPPFEPGNEMSLQHGAHSERRLAPVVAQLEEEIRVLAPWTARPAFQAATRAWATAEAVCDAYRSWFFEHGLRDEDGEPLPGLVQWDRAEARAAKLRARLSLDPAALASLLHKLSEVEGRGGARASAEREAIQREIADLETQVVAALQRKEIESGE